ncbi:ornithine cyclodeaminase family protein [Thiolinea disciformis]|uniref:ornithine cyclodeaminase family protein n=1 Tax=Thiolinea disciformis TaxID=125614 RepID=UPI00036D7525|nr:ornithine cyclodeaminase family protein [Thiolinea disciformis]
MRIYSAQETANALPYPALIEQISTLFASGLTAPLRHHHTLPNPQGQANTLLLMPAWQGVQGYGGVKIVNVTPDNAQRGLPAVAASYLLFSETTGEHVALLDGSVLTARRTAAASALGARYLANPQAKTLLIIGAGRVARELPEAFASLFPLQKVLIWNRSPARAHELLNSLQTLQRWELALVSDLASAVAQSDLISCATLAQAPVLMGEWLQAGQHLDLIGSFTPQMREVDDTALQRARVYIDTEAALKESGDLVIPLQQGVLKASDIQGSLYELCKLSQTQYDPKAITLFKGVGHAVEDLAAAIVAYET